MPAFHLWRARARRSLDLHLERLHDTLAILTQRLRDAVAQAIGSTVAAAAREAIQVASTDPSCGPMTPQAAPRPRYASPPRWGEPPRYPDDDPEALQEREWRAEREQSWRFVDDDESPPADTDQPIQPQEVRLHRALSLGCQAAAWWLRRQVGRFSALAALGVGTVCTAAAYFVGTGLASSALGFLVLADAIHSGTALLT